MWVISSSAFLPFALQRGAAVYAHSHSIASLAASTSVRPHRLKYISKRAAKPYGPCLLLRKKLSIDTASVCVDFALCLVFAGIWESAAGSESKAAVVGGMNSPTVTDREPCAGNTVSEPDGYVLLFPISHEFPVAIKRLLFRPSNLIVQGINADMKL